MLRVKTDGDQVNGHCPSPFDKNASIHICFLTVKTWLPILKHLENVSQLLKTTLINQNYRSGGVPGLYTLMGSAEHTNMLHKSSVCNVNTAC